MTNTPSNRIVEAQNADERVNIARNIASLAQGVRLLQPVFTNHLDIKQQRAIVEEKTAHGQRTGLLQPIIPAICYPFALTEYELPSDLGTYIFQQALGGTDTVIDCHELGIQNQQDLIELCMADSAADFLADLVLNQAQASANSS